MFGVGSGELLLLVLIAVIILGPRETAVWLKKIKKSISQFKEYQRDIEDDIHKEHDDMDIK